MGLHNEYIQNKTATPPHSGPKVRVPGPVVEVLWNRGKGNIFACPVRDKWVSLVN